MRSPSVAIGSPPQDQIMIGQSKDLGLLASIIVEACARIAEQRFNRFPNSYDHQLGREIATEIRKLKRERWVENNSRSRQSRDESEALSEQGCEQCRGNGAEHQDPRHLRRPCPDVSP